MGAQARWAGCVPSTVTSAICERKASLGLVGETVVIAKGKKRAWKQKGKLVEYDTRRDEHWYVERAWCAGYGAESRAGEAGDCEEY